MDSRFDSGHVTSTGWWGKQLTCFSSVPVLSYASVPSVSGASSFPLSLPITLPARAGALAPAQGRWRLGSVGSNCFTCGYHGNLRLQQCLQLAHLALCMWGQWTRTDLCRVQWTGETIKFIRASQDTNEDFWHLFIILESFTCVHSYLSEFTWIRVVVSINAMSIRSVLSVYYLVYTVLCNAC